jgi:hypothetical protein
MKIRIVCPACQQNNLDSQPVVLMPFIANRIFGWDSAYIDSSWELADITQGHLTFGCKSLYCQSCQTTFLDMGFDTDEMSRLYSGYRSTKYNKLRSKYEPSYRQRASELSLGYEYLPFVEKHISKYLTKPATNVFDWGGDIGLNTPFKKTANIFIYYPSGQTTSSATRHVFTSLESAQQHCHLFVSMNVLEHLPDPLESLLSVIKHISADLYYFEVPLEKFVLNYSDLESDFWRKKKHWHEHINCFTPKSLRVLISNSGLQPLSCDHRIYPNHGRDEHIISCIAVRPDSDMART